MSSIARTNPPTPKRLDLETRIADRKQELIAELIEHKMSSRVGAAEAIYKIKDRLSELAQIVKPGVAGGWSNVGDDARRKLDAWIAKT